MNSTRTSRASGNAAPPTTLSRSAVRSPMTTPSSFRQNAMTAWSSASPPMGAFALATIPPSTKTATSVVPPPMSTTMDPFAASTSRPAPTAAASGSETIATRRAPACSAASSTARRSTCVTPEGTQTMIRGLTNRLR